MKRFSMLITVLTPTISYTQVPDGDAFVIGETNFFISIIAGVFLAVGFQLLLTAVSVASGISAVGNLRSKSHDSSHHTHDEHHEGMNTGQKISTGLGLWTLITTTLSLFFASLLAVKLGLIGANMIGATLGLVIWAAFFMLITYLEINMVSSIIGGLAATIKHSLSAVFSKSEEKISKEVAKTRSKEEAKQMRKQFEKMFSSHDIDKKVEEYVQKLEPQRIDIKKLKKELKDLITDLQITEKADFDYPNSVKKIMLEEVDKSPLSQEEKQAVKDHIHSLKDIARSDASNQEKIKAGISDLTPADKEQVEHYQKKIKETLRNSKNEELQPEKLESDLKRILDDPKQASQVIKAKASAIDRPTLVELLKSQNMSQEEADKRVSQAEKVLNKISSTFRGASGNGSSPGKGTKRTLQDAQEKVRQIFTGTSTDLNRIYSDFVSIFRDSGTGPDIQYKLKHYNEAEMTALIENRTSLSRPEAASIAEKIVSARDSVLDKSQELQAKVNEKMAEAKQKTLLAAEESRKAAATAAWWFVATAVVSGIASAVGGMLAIDAFNF